MKIENYTFPKSSFLSVEKDMGLIAQLILKNERLKKLLYYTTPDCLSKNNLTQEESISLIKNNIKIVPKLFVDNSIANYIIISFDNFYTNPTNPEFRNNIIEFDIVCHFDQWQLKDFQLRPFKIAAELDYMLNNKHLTGIGKVAFIGGNIEVFTDEYAGICLRYLAIHGEEDKKFMPNPADEEQFLKEFNEIFNNK